MPFKSELIAKQDTSTEVTDKERKPVSDGIDIVVGKDEAGNEIVRAVIADAEKITPEAFEDYLKDQGFQTGFSGKSEGQEGDGVEREDTGKVYRLDDGSDKPSAEEYSKPVTSLDTSLALFADDREKDLHVLRAGPLHDLDSGDLVLDLPESRLAEIAATTQALIDAGHAVPISFEHGIEAGYRGVPGVDRRPYGEILAVYYDQDRKAIYAKKRWSKLGRDIVEASLINNDVSALRISPRIRLTPAFHPDDGSLLGDSGYLDVISLTSLPRQPQMANVALSRTEIEEQEKNQEETDNLIQKDQVIDKMDMGNILTTGDLSSGGTTEIESQGHKGCNMAESNKAEIEQNVDVLLGRGSDEAKRITDTLGLGQDVDGLELARRVETMKNEIEEVTVELNRYKAKEAEANQARLEAEADKLLDGCELQGAERDFYRASLLGDDDTAREFARKAITEKGQPDQLVKVTEAVEAAKERGSLAADFELTEEIKELSRDNSDIAVKLFEAIPAGMVVRVGEPQGSDSAGIEAEPSNLNPVDAEFELSQLARRLRNEGKANNAVEAWELARKERGDLSAVLNGDK